MHSQLLAAQRRLSRRWSLAMTAIASVALAVAATCSPMADAHHDSAIAAATQAPLADGTRVQLAGRLSILEIVGLRGASHERIIALVSEDGRALRVKLANGMRFGNGAAVSLSGQMSRGALIVDSASEQAAAKSAAGNAAAAVVGSLQLFHFDEFDSGHSYFAWRVQDDSGKRTTIRFAIAPESLVPGMRVSVTGTTDGSAIDPSSVTVVDAAPAQQITSGPAPSAPTSVSVLVILVKFTDTATEPFTQAAALTTMNAAGTGVGPYWNEASFGALAMSGTVTPWLRASFATPTWCDASSSHPQSAYDMIETAGNQLAQSAGYVLGNYTRFVYLFAKVNACGWAGLGEVGGPHAWSNGVNALWVIGHEIGHTLGLGHANSLPCNGAVISTTCPLNRPEYADPFNIMGNVRTMHVSAWQKNYLGWIADAKVATWTGGTRTYLLSPIETGGGTLYAVQVPAAYHRTYWLEFRQAIGFDSLLPASATNGAIVHLNGVMHQSDRSEYGCWDNCFLDMTPGSTGGMADGALAVGSSYTDVYTGITLSAVSKGAGGLTVSVAGPPTLKQLALYRPTVGKFLFDYGFDHTPDVRLPFGMAGDVPVSGRVSFGGLSAVGVYRNGTWYLDTNLNGVADRTIAFGGAPTDKPLMADFNNDGQDDLVIYRNGVWYVDQFLNGTVDKTFGFGGAPNDIPLAGDVNGDGIADLVIYRNGVWYIDTNRNGVPDVIVYFGGLPQDRPYLFDWNGDGKADLVIFRDGIWYVNTQLDGTAQAIFGYGASGDIPFAGRFY